MLLRSDALSTNQRLIQRKASEDISTPRPPHMLTSNSLTYLGFSVNCTKSQLTLNINQTIVFQDRNRGANREIAPPKFLKACLAVRHNSKLQSFCPLPKNISVLSCQLSRNPAWAKYIKRIQSTPESNKTCLVCDTYFNCDTYCLVCDTIWWITSATQNTLFRWKNSLVVFEKKCFCGWKNIFVIAYVTKGCKTKVYKGI